MESGLQRNLGHLPRLAQVPKVNSRRVAIQIVQLMAGNTKETEKHQKTTLKLKRGNSDFMFLFSGLGFVGSPEMSEGRSHGIFFGGNLKVSFN